MGFYRKMMRTRTQNKTTEEMLGEIYMNKNSDMHQTESQLLWTYMRREKLALA